MKIIGPPSARASAEFDNGVYHTFSGIIFDHCKYVIRSFKSGPKQICAVFGPTCDALDTISLAEELPESRHRRFVV